MIDKLDLRVPGHVPFSEGFQYVYGSLRGDSRRWRTTKHYSASAAFDDCGFDVLLHMGCQMTKKPMHKIEILRTGEKSYGEMVKLLGSVFATDPEGLGIMRVDLTADVPDVPVDWFKRHTIVKAKQTAREHGKVGDYLTVGKGRAETLYRGVKPNQIRIYDKAAERRMQYEREMTRFARLSRDEPALEPTSFETLYGHGMYDVITRVERQVGARDVEKMGFSNLASLQRAVLIDPFEKILFFDVPEVEHEDPNLTTTEYLAQEALRARVRQFGMTETLRWLRSREGKNYDRAKRKYASALRVTDNLVGIDSGRLRQLFLASTHRQMLRAA